MENSSSSIAVQHMEYKWPTKSLNYPSLFKCMDLECDSRAWKENLSAQEAEGIFNDFMARDQSNQTIADRRMLEKLRNIISLPTLARKYPKSSDMYMYADLFELDCNEVKVPEHPVYGSYYIEPSACYYFDKCLSNAPKEQHSSLSTKLMTMLVIWPIPFEPEFATKLICQHTDSNNRSLVTALFRSRYTMMEDIQEIFHNIEKEIENITKEV